MMMYNSYSYKRGVTGFYPKAQKFVWSCYHMNCCLQKYIIHQFTYVIYYLFQENFKNAKNYENPRSTSKDTCKTNFLLFLYCFLLVTHLNLMRLKKRD